MNELRFFHLFANGDDAVNFIISKDDFVFQFNLVGICAHKSSVVVAAFSIEETHPHFLLFGTREKVSLFKQMYKRSTMRHISATRGSSDGVILNFGCYEVDNQDYLRNVAAYVIIQPTKDGKPIMFYDYKWGSGSLYFRSKDHVPIWLYSDSCDPERLISIAEMDYKTRLAVCGRNVLPGDWMVCGNLILPSNYVDIPLYESIFRTYNCFRVFLGSSSRQSEQVRETMAGVRGIELNDYEAREILSKLSLQQYNTKDIRKLDSQARLCLALMLKKQYGMSRRQLAVICRLPEIELQKYYK